MSKPKEMSPEARIFSKLVGAYSFGMLGILFMIMAIESENTRGISIVIGTWISLVISWQLARKNQIVPAISIFTIATCVGCIDAVLHSPGLDPRQIVIPFMFIPVLISSFLIDARIVTIQALIAGVSAFFVVTYIGRPADVTLYYLFAFLMIACGLCVFGSILNRKRQNELWKIRSALFGSSKLIGLGELASKVAHEINNPLTVLSFASHFLIDELKSHPNALVSDNFVKNIERINANGKRIENIVKILSQASKDSKLSNLMCISINSEIEAVVALAHTSFSEQNIKIELAIPINTIASFNPIAFTQIMVNLINNAIDALKSSPLEQRKIMISAETILTAVFIKISDSGPGIPEKIRSKIFQPFFTTKGTNGTGVGLNVSAELAEQFGGSLKLSESRNGAEFIVQMQRVTETKEPAV